MEGLEGLSKWKQCETIGKVIFDKLSEEFSKGAVSYKIEEYASWKQKMFSISVDYRGLMFTINVEDRDTYEKPFVCTFGFDRRGNSRDEELDIKAMDCIASLVEKGVFKNLNIYDYGDEELMKKYHFLKAQFNNNWEDG